MSFIEAIQICLIKFKDFGGRASRSEFWWFALAIVLISFAVGFLSVPLARLGLVGLLVQPLLALVLFVPFSAAGYRRLHDLNWPGWPFLVPLALTVLSSRPAYFLMWFLAGDARPSSDLQFAMAQFVAILFMFSAWASLPAWGVLAYFLARPGGDKANVYGPPPSK
jgi:uncharacterized membrane protein YhaH (DUF805 family)